MKPHDFRSKGFVWVLGVLGWVFGFLGVGFEGYGQVQIGLDIDGESGQDLSGVSVSMPNPFTVAVGASNNDGNGNESGQVRIYDWIGSAWVQRGSDIDGEAADDFSGETVDMPDANTVAIGAFWNDGNGNTSGHVRIYDWNGTGWVQKGLDIDGEAAGDNSGLALGMPDANTVAIGAHLNDGNGNNAGHVRIYAWNGSAWIQKGADIDGEATGDSFGRRVSMPDANTVGIGAPGNDANGPGSGHVRVYTWNGTAWIQKGSDIDGEAAGDFSGISLSMPDANTVAIGANENDGNGSDAGHVRIYGWNGSAWVQKGQDLDGEAAGDESGFSVVMPNAYTVAVGAPQNDGSGTDAGHVRIYGWNGSAWVQRWMEIDGETAVDKSGWSVAVPDGSTVAIGAYLNDGAAVSAGHVRVYGLCNNSMDTISAVACGSYLSPSGMHVWVSSGVYTDIVPNAVGCDSVIMVNLTVNIVDVSVTVASATLTANAVGASYQWLDCNNGMAAISGATLSSFTAVESGSYAVAVTINGCTDTSDCEEVTVVGISGDGDGRGWVVSPNPSDGAFGVNLGKEYGDVAIVVRDASGKEVVGEAFGKGKRVEFEIAVEAGVYFVEVLADGEREVFRVVKE